MKPTPPGWPRISPALFYTDPRRAIDWLCQAFGFEVRILVDGPDGSVMHSELTYGDGVIMVSGASAEAPGPDSHWRQRLTSPASIGGRVTQALAVYVDDVQAHHDRAAAHGAEICDPLTTQDYGPEYWSDRGYGAYDCEGHRWWFMQRLRTGSA
ncbi:MAG: VOC family protein [Planctomycetes bacterium]|nr:VOC family protein [Planctomycetota bacterium]MCB9886175.1 VOC family protein [Planctomycetota bacterium]